MKSRNLEKSKVEKSKSRQRNDLDRVEALCEWFEREARDLPWRRRRTGYTALVAESMLQQTQVARVIERYRSFIKRFPSVRSLAAADEQEVLALWQGLGYYRRARNLHGTAKMIMSEFGGRLPKTVAELQRLPGVGRYTAGAIASMVYGAAEPIVDGNVQRVLARWFGWRESPDSSESVARAWKTAKILVKLGPRPGVFNEAMMELGAMVCTPKSPRCAACPVLKSCIAQRGGIQARIPRAKIRTKPQAVHHHAVIVTRRGKHGLRVLVEQRKSSGMWAHMWQTPTIESDRELDAAALQSLLGPRFSGLRKRHWFEHHTTHRRIRFHVFSASSKFRSGVWTTLDDLADLPMSNAQRRVLGQLCSGGPHASASKSEPSN